MLSAAHDILSPKLGNNTIVNGTTIEPPVNDTRLIPDCNPISTGAILLADILPTLIVKLTAPFYMQAIAYWIRVSIVVVFAAVSFPIVAASQSIGFSLFGVVCASTSAGFGEITFLALSSHFHKDVVSTWSSGTGAAGVFGALTYAGLIAAGLSPSNTLYTMLTIPLILGLSYFVLLVKPSTVRSKPIMNSGGILEEDDSLIADSHAQPSMSIINKLNLIKPILPMMIFLMVVYFAEYFINQGLQELVYFDNIWLTLTQQYRWYQVIYQIGVFISRSSVNIFRIRKTWILSILQILNVVLLLCQIFLKFIPSIWIIFVIILYEGLLGGLAYVNTFYWISTDIPEEHREYSMGIASVSDSVGIAIAGAVALPVHNYICTL